VKTSEQETYTPSDSKFLPDGREALGYDEARAELDAFVANPGLDELASLFGVEELPDDPRERLHKLEELAAAHWDFRKGAERQATDWNDELLDQEGSEQWEAVFSGADKLGLVESSTAKNKHPQTLMFYGAANRAPFDRLRYGLEQVEDFGQLVYLGCSRPVSDGEREEAKDYAPDAQTEFDLGWGALETLLDAKMTDEVSWERDGDTWGMRLYEFEKDGETKHAFALSTPQYIGEERANTYDNLRFFADRAELAEDPDHTIVAVTNAFYTGGQGLPGVQELTLPFGTEIETIGFDAAYGGKVRKPSQLLQETKAAVDAAVRLEAALDQAA